MQKTLESLVSNVDGALGAAVVDLGTGLLLGAHHSVPYFTQSYIDAVGAAAVDMFRGKNVSSVEKMLAAQRGEEAKPLITEVQMTTDGTYHFMIVIPNKPDSLLVLITRKTTNLGMGWAAVRRALVEVGPFCP